MLNNFSKKPKFKTSFIVSNNGVIANMKKGIIEYVVAVPVLLAKRPNVKPSVR